MQCRKFLTSQRFQKLFDRMWICKLTTKLRCTATAVQIQTAGIFLVGCPACNQNFKHFFCTLTCSPDQSLFTNVTSVQSAYDNNRTAVDAIDVFVANTYGQSFYDSCKVRAYLPCSAQDSLQSLP